ncbi:MAG: lytic transglycosylase domain-containing protein [Chloroflexota bacterium]
MTRFLRIAFIIFVGAALAMLGLNSHATSISATPTKGLKRAESKPAILASIWAPSIQQWSPQIAQIAQQYGLDPDFLAAVMAEESDGDPHAVSYVGAIGLMGIMPTGPGLEWRPSPDELKDPLTNLRWGGAILAEIITQSGGDLFAALTAYSGGWEHANSRVPRAYAASVLDAYGRAIAMRNGISPDIASQWTVAIEINQGNVPTESLMILGQQPISGLRMYGEHTVYDHYDESGRSLYVKGYAVPVALIQPADVYETNFGSDQEIELQLMLRLGEESPKIVKNSNPNVLIACLPSLSRLRGRVSTRWFAPSQCPEWHR